MTSPFEKMYLISEEEYLERRGVEPAQIDNDDDDTPLPDMSDEPPSDITPAPTPESQRTLTYDESYLTDSSMDDSTRTILNESIANERENLNRLKIEYVKYRSLPRQLNERRSILATARATSVRLTILKRASESARSRAALLKLINDYRYRQVTLPTEPLQDLFQLSPQAMQLPWHDLGVEILDNSFDAITLAAIPVNMQVSFVEDVVLAGDENEAGQIVDAAREYMNNSIMELDSENKMLARSIRQVENDPHMLSVAQL